MLMEVKRSLRETVDRERQIKELATDTEVDSLHSICLHSSIIQNNFACQYQMHYTVWRELFAFFEGRAKIKTGRNSHTPVLHMQILWWVWFLGIETRKFLLRASRAIPQKFPAIRYYGQMSTP